MGDESKYEFYVDPSSEASVFAVDKETKGVRPDGLVEGFAGTFDRPNSPVSWTTVDPSVLGEEISQEKAREVHPRLFERLDRDK